MTAGLSMSTPLDPQVFSGTVLLLLSYAWLLLGQSHLSRSSIQITSHETIEFW
jgi:hypothetical protein